MTCPVNYFFFIKRVELDHGHDNNNKNNNNYTTTNNNNYNNDNNYWITDVFVISFLLWIIQFINGVRTHDLLIAIISYNPLVWTALGPEIFKKSKCRGENLICKFRIEKVSSKGMMSFIINCTFWWIYVSGAFLPQCGSTNKTGGFYNLRLFVLMQLKEHMTRTQFFVSKEIITQKL